jgi:hypothetical protein
MVRSRVLAHQGYHSAVDDLKLEPREGGVALWVGPGTDGYFSNLKITSR